jgi:capsular polysaccharide transport system permease protein
LDYELVTTTTNKAPSKPKATKPQVRTKFRVIEVAPIATPAQFRLRHWIVLLSFFVCVVGPATAAGWYLYQRAADQYSSNVGFAVRREEAGSPLDLLGGITNISNASSSDTDILYEFIQSQEMVREMDDLLDLRTLFSRPSNDPMLSLDPNASIEDLVDFWKRMVRIFYNPGTGLIEVEVRAFSAKDAQLIAQALFDRSSQMINELSSIARKDVTLYAKEELALAISRLKQARAALTSFRNETRIVDPTADIQGQMGLLNSLQAQLAEALIELDLIIGTTRDSDPRVTQARRRIEVIETRIEEERRKLGVSGTTDNANSAVFADLVGEFESLRVDLEFAEQAYVAALSAHDSTLSEARRKSRYLAAYLEPTLAETPRYPQREMILAIVGFVLFACWTIIVLTYYSLRDRR